MNPLSLWHLTYGAERLVPEAGSPKGRQPKEAVRSSSLMGGLCKRTDSKMLGKQAERHMMVRAHHFGIHLSLPIVLSLLWAGTFSIPRTINYYTLRAFPRIICGMIAYLSELVE